MKFGKKTICLDYDGSYNEFPELFEIIIKECERLNYRVILATMRTKEEADEGLLTLQKRIPVFYTSRKAKKEFLKKLGVEPDLWIDDNPIWLYING